MEDPIREAIFGAWKVRDLNDPEVRGDMTLTEAAVDLSKHILSVCREVKGKVSDVFDSNLRGLSYLINF